MALRSKLFRGDTKLEACLVSDAAHVMPGAVGHHVAKIQSALARLDNAEIAAGEISVERYGPSTTNAVLAYKKKRGIINYSYQSAADNIVGKMTIARLDQELATAEEEHHTPSFGCGDCIEGAGAAPRVVFAQQASFMATAGAARPAYLTGGGPGIALAAQKYNRELHVFLLRTKLVTPAEVYAQSGQISHATDLLRPFGMEVAPHSELTTPINHSDIVRPHYQDECLKVRHAASYYDSEYPHALRIIYTRFNRGLRYFGNTEHGTYEKKYYRFFVLVNVEKVRSDQSMIIHEMIHGTGLVTHDSTQDDPTSVFSEDMNRSVLHDHHAERLANAFFSRPR